MDRWGDDLVVVPTWAVRDRRQILWWCEPDAPVILRSACAGAELTFDRGTHEVLVNGQQLDLDKRATEVLELLLLRAGQTVGLQELARTPGEESLSATSCRVLIHRLRLALGPEFGKELVTTRRSGYRWIAPVSVVDARTMPRPRRGCRSRR